MTPVPISDWSSNFGTFLCDTEQERAEAGVREHCISLWTHLNQVEILSQHLNCLYVPNKVTQLITSLKKYLTFYPPRV